jgi:hypothetical protein
LEVIVSWSQAQRKFYETSALADIEFHVWYP